MLIPGDCFDLLPEMPPESVDFILADLPFGTTRCRWDTPIDLERLWPELWRVLVPKGTIVMFGVQPFSSRLVSSDYENFRYQWVWEKPKASGHLNAKRQPLRAHEDLLVFGRSQGVYNPQLVQGLPYKGSRRPASRNTEHYSKYGSAREDNPGIRYPRSVLKFGHVRAKKGEKLHAVEKPVPLLRYLIRTYSNPGNMVLDPCAGSGSTGIAAILEDRKFTGFEIDEKLCQEANQRLETKKL